MVNDFCIQTYAEKEQKCKAFEYENGESESESERGSKIETNLMGTNLLPYLLLTGNHRTGKTISNSNFHNNFLNVLEKHVRGETAKKRR